MPVQGAIMESYIYTVRIVEGRNKKNKREIVVYSVVDNIPEMIGEKVIDLASYPGDRATAKKIIAEAKGYTMTDQYSLGVEINLNYIR